MKAGRIGESSARPFGDERFAERPARLSQTTYDAGVRVGAGNSPRYNACTSAPSSTDAAGSDAAAASEILGIAYAGGRERLGGSRERRRSGQA